MIWIYIENVVILSQWWVILIRYAHILKKKVRLYDRKHLWQFTSLSHSLSRSVSSFHHSGAMMRKWNYILWQWWWWHDSHVNLFTKLFFKLKCILYGMMLLMFINQSSKGRKVRKRSIEKNLKHTSKQQQMSNFKRVY